MSRRRTTPGKFRDRDALYTLADFRGESGEPDVGSGARQARTEREIAFIVLLHPFVEWLLLSYPAPYTVRFVCRLSDGVDAEVVAVDLADALERHRPAAMVFEFGHVTPGLRRGAGR